MLFKMLFLTLLFSCGTPAAIDASSLSSSAVSLQGSRSPSVSFCCSLSLLLSNTLHLLSQLFVYLSSLSITTVSMRQQCHNPLHNRLHPFKNEPRSVSNRGNCSLYRSCLLRSDRTFQLSAQTIQSFSFWKFLIRWRFNLSPWWLNCDAVCLEIDETNGSRDGRVEWEVLIGADPVSIAACLWKSPDEGV